MLSRSAALTVTLSAMTAFVVATFSACDPQSPTGSAAVTPAAAAPPAQVPATPLPAQDRLVGPIPSLAPLVKELRPSVVNIYTTQAVRPRRQQSPFGGPSPEDPMQDFFERFFGGNGGGRAPSVPRQALGSGFLVGEGYVLTNNHVIEGADEIRVALADGREFAVKVVGRDPATDIGLLQLTGEGAKDLPSVRLGDSDGLEVGDYVVAIGNPFGLSLTVTSGIVSAKERNIGAGPYDDFIQTDASINPGNSGGPLFNLRGEVVGVNTAIVARGQGIGFAVPINLVKELLPQLREKGKVTRGWLGVGIQEITPELARTFRLGNVRGALVSQVFPEGPAAKAGIEPGDVVVEFGGRKVDSPGALSRAVAATPPGRSAKARLLRDGKERTLDVKVTERDEAVIAGGGSPGGDEAHGATVGLTVSPITPELARRLGVPEGEGLAITAVRAGSAAEAAGVREGDVLLSLQRQPTTTVEAYRKVARTVEAGDTVLFRVRRGGSALFLAARAPKNP